MPARGRVLLLALAGSFVGAAGQDSGSTPACGWADPASGVKFDLSPLTAKAAYQFRGTIGSHDSLAAAHGDEPAVTTPAASNHFEDYTYFVNLCKEVSFEETNTLDEFGAIHASTNPCAGKPSAAVYQIFRDTNNPACFALGSSKEGNGGSMEWRLLDPDDPNKGLQLKYGGGEVCNRRTETPGVADPAEPTEDPEQVAPDPEVPPPPPPYVYVEPVVTWEEIPRTVTLNFTCDPDQGDDIASVIAMAGKIHASEPEMCEYTLVWPTRLACPLSMHLNYDGEAMTHTARASYSAGGAAGGGGGGGGGGLVFWWLVAVVVFGGLVIGYRDSTRSLLVKLSPGPLRSFLEPGAGGLGMLLGATGSSPRGGKLS